MKSIFGMFMESWILRVSYKVNVKPFRFHLLCKRPKVFMIPWTFQKMNSFHRYTFILILEPKHWLCRQFLRGKIFDLKSHCLFRFAHFKEYQRHSCKLTHYYLSHQVAVYLKTVKALRWLWLEILKPQEIQLCYSRTTKAQISLRTRTVLLAHLFIQI